VSGAAYVVRPSAYALIRDGEGRQARVALVRTPQGVYLPGGGIEAGETAPEAIVREAVEECGLAVRIPEGAWLAAAVQFCYSVPEGEYFEKLCVFFEAEIVGAPGGATEADHELFWEPLDSAPSTLAHESHAWALRAWPSRATISDTRNPKSGNP
jgi:8-oxo-dGTP diphosphatase